jgi:hypothetical protein
VGTERRRTTLTLREQNQIAVCRGQMCHAADRWGDTPAPNSPFPAFPVLVDVLLSVQSENFVFARSGARLG